MRKSNKKNNSKKENELKLKINKAKEDLSVQIIQYNHKIKDVLQKMSVMIQECMDSDKSFVGQRELLSRNKMNIRVLNSAIKMLDNNQLQLWMIDEKTLEEKVKNDNK